MSRTFYREFYEWRACVDHLKHSIPSIAKASDWLTKQRFFYIFQALDNNVRHLLILDVGCAEGVLPFHLASVGANVIGIDISSTRLHKANLRSKKAPEKNVDFIVCDAENLPLRSHLFDIAICAELLEHVPHSNKLLTELFDVVKGYGKVLLEVPNESKTTVARLFGFPLLLARNVSRLFRKDTRDVMGGDMRFLRKKTVNGLLLYAPDDFNEHLNSFTPNVLKILLENCGFDFGKFHLTVPLGLSVVPLFTNFPKMITVMNYINKLLQYLPGIEKHSDLLLIEASKKVLSRSNT